MTENWKACPPRAPYELPCFQFEDHWLLQQTGRGMWLLFEKVEGVLDQGRTIATFKGEMSAQRAQEVAHTFFIFQDDHVATMTLPAAERASSPKSSNH